MAKQVANKQMTERADSPEMREAQQRVRVTLHLSLCSECPLLSVQHTFRTVIAESYFERYATISFLPVIGNRGAAGAEEGSTAAPDGDAGR